MANASWGICLKPGNLVGGEKQTATSFAPVLSWAVCMEISERIAARIRPSLCESPVGRFEPGTD